MDRTEREGKILDLFRNAARQKQKLIAAHLDVPPQRIQEALSERHSRTIPVQKVWAYLLEMEDYEIEALLKLMVPPRRKRPREAA